MNPGLQNICSMLFVLIQNWLWCYASSHQETGTEKQYSLFTHEGQGLRQTWGFQSLIEEILEIEETNMNIRNKVTTFQISHKYFACNNTNNDTLNKRINESFHRLKYNNERLYVILCWSLRRFSGVDKNIHMTSMKMRVTGKWCTVANC